MAIYHLSVKTVARSAGRSATAAAAYRAGDRIECEREGRVHDYTRKQGVEHTEIIAPGIAQWFSSRAELWNAVELAETRKNSTVAREYEVALPAELSAAERVDLARDFARAVSERYGVAADVAIHAPNREGDQRNWHAHILTTTRQVTAEGLGAKTRVLDDQKTGPAQVLELRSLWAQLSNEALEKHGHAQRVTEKSFATILETKREALAQTAEGSAERLAAERDVLRVRTLAENKAPHMGPAVAAIEARERRQADAEGRAYEPATQIGAEMDRASRVRETLRGYLQAFNAYAREGYAHTAERLRSAFSVFGRDQKTEAPERAREEARAPREIARQEAGGPARAPESAPPAPAGEPRSFLERREAVQAAPALSPEQIEQRRIDLANAERLHKEDERRQSFLDRQRAEWKAQEERLAGLSPEERQRAIDRENADKILRAEEERRSFLERREQEGPQRQEGDRQQGRDRGEDYGQER